MSFWSLGPKQVLSFLVDIPLLLTNLSRTQPGLQTVFILLFFIVLCLRLLTLFLSDFESLESQDNSLNEDDFSVDILSVLDGAKKLSQYDATRRQATSIIMLAVIGSEFQKDLGSMLATKTEITQKKVTFNDGKLLQLSLFSTRCFSAAFCYWE